MQSHLLGEGGDDSQDPETSWVKLLFHLYAKENIRSLSEIG